jgi:hypothetical protein
MQNAFEHKTKTTESKMKSLFILAIALVSTSAFARPNTLNMTCRDAAGLVADAGSIVLSTGANTYNRFYATGIKAAYVPTLDNDACFIGYVKGQDGRDRAPELVKAAPACKSGKVEQVNQQDRGEANFKPVYRTCVNGKWVIPGYVAAPAVRKCKEGSMGSLGTGRYFGPNEQEVPAVCRNGKFVPLY